jgi:hypothetical protein
VPAGAAAREAQVLGGFGGKTVGKDALVGGEAERAEELRALRRRVAERWPETDFRELLLNILDEMVWEAHKFTAEAE